MFKSDWKRREWEAWHYRFGLAGEGQGEAFLVLHDQQSGGAARSASGRVMVVVGGG